MVSAIAALLLRDSLGQVLQPIHSSLHNQLDQGEIVKGRELFTLFGSDIGVDQVTHGRLIHLQIDVVATGQLDLGAHLFVIIHLLLDLLDFLCGVTCLRHLIGKVRIGADQ